MGADNIRLGLCCLNLTLQEQKPSIYPSRTITLDGVERLGFNELKARVLQNLRDLLVMIDWNEENGIHVFRLSSNIFPHFSNPRLPEQYSREYTMEFALPLLREIGEKIRKYKHRVTFHPGQYNVLGTPRPDILQVTIKELTYHADMLEFIGADKHSIMVIHGGGLYGDKAAAMKRWCDVYKRQLPAYVRNRLVLENDERYFSIEDCLEMHKRVGVPICFDVFHHICYKRIHINDAGALGDASDYIAPVLKTWEKRGIRPKFHLSEQGRGKIGHHSDYVNEIPEYLLDIPKKYGVDIDIMIEAKMKERAILRLYDKYPALRLMPISKKPDNTR